MPAARHTSSFQDLIPLLDRVAQAPGFRLVCRTEGKAQNTMMRCHQFRKLLRELDAKKLGAIDGYEGSSPYDHILIRRDGSTLIFDHRAQEDAASLGTLLDPEGQPTKLESETASRDSTNEANALPFDPLSLPDIPDFEEEDDKNS